MYRPNHSVYNRNESASYLGPKIWEQIRAEIKNKDSHNSFKKKINKWKPTKYPCRICKDFYTKFSFCLIKI